MASATQGLDSIVEHMCPLFCGLCVYAPDQMVVNISTHTLEGQISCSLVKTSKWKKNKTSYLGFQKKKKSLADIFSFID